MENEKVQQAGSNLRKPEVGLAAHTLPVSESPIGPAAPTERTTYRRRTILPLVAISLVLGFWSISGYVLAYSDDAYITSDVVQVTPRVAGPVEAVRVNDNQ
jgi:membrane fusion protein, multidrug efflux system